MYIDRTTKKRGAVMSNKENKKWFVNSDGDITDGDALIAEPNYLSRDGHKNAHLIAAAPELLEAIESILSYFTTSGNFEMHEHYADEFKEDFIEVVNAQKKARGG